MTSSIETLFERRLPAQEPFLSARLSSGYGGDLVLPDEFLIANFVTTLDGVASLGKDVPPSAIALKNETDRLVMSILRAAADCVLIGAGTLRAEPEHLWSANSLLPEMNEEFLQLRAHAGLEPSPRLAIVSRTGDLPPRAKALDMSPMILTTSKGAQRVQQLGISSSDLILLPEAPDPSSIIDAVRNRGYLRVLSEAGPHLFGQLIQARLVNELFLTVSPALAGSSEEHLHLVEAGHFPSLVEADLVSVKRSGAHLFLRYSF